MLMKWVHAYDSAENENVAQKKRAILIMEKSWISPKVICSSPKISTWTVHFSCQSNWSNQKVWLNEKQPIDVKDHENY